MNLYVYNTNFQILDVIDSFKSLIWTERNCEHGDFELYLPLDKVKSSLLVRDNFLMKRDSDIPMVIETIKFETGEDGKFAIISGRSGSCYLERRIIWGQLVLTGNFQNGISTILNNAIINPSNSDRKINNFSFKTSTNTEITSLTIDSQFFGDNVYSCIKEACGRRRIGFRVYVENNKFVFELTKGQDRSYKQFGNPWIVFSPKFDNLISSSYVQSQENYKNVALSAGEGEGSDRTLVTSSVGTNLVGLNRFETFVDCSDISKTTEEGEVTQADYEKQLSDKGLTELYDKALEEDFEGSIDPNKQYKYGEDYFLGDIVEVVNEYGMASRSKVTEIIHSITSEEETMIPTFETVE